MPLMPMTIIPIIDTDVRRALSHEHINNRGISAAPLSPAALPFLEEIARSVRRKRQDDISEILYICLRLCIYPIIVKITAFIVVF